MIVNQSSIKAKVLGMQQYSQTISNFNQQLNALEPQQKRQILNGRYRNEYKKIIQCSNSNVFETKKLECIKQTLHSCCLSEFQTFVQCLKTTKNKKQCDKPVGQYFFCVDKRMKNIYWSGSMYF